jgi:uncharacterized membrane protein YeaQ/YmgE (transglycosylase-associated protein family)
LGKYIRTYHRRGGMTVSQKAGAVGIMVAMVLLSTFVFIPAGSVARIIVPIAGAVGVLTVVLWCPMPRTMSSGRPREVFLVGEVRDGQIVVGRHGVTYNYVAKHRLYP